MGLKISNLPINERPREKAIRYGFNTLSDIEVLAIIISSGTKDFSALDLSSTVLSNFGGLYNTVNKSFLEFKSFKGIKTATAAKLCAIFEIAKRYNSIRIIQDSEKEEINSLSLFEKYLIPLRELGQETLVLIVLDKKKKVLFETELFKGSRHSINFKVRDILKTVILHDGYYFYVIHNHPSGDIEPSESDINFTTKLISSGKEVGIYLVDHLIISRNGYYSFLQKDVKEETN